MSTAVGVRVGHYGNCNVELPRRENNEHFYLAFKNAAPFAITQLPILSMPRLLLSVIFSCSVLNPAILVKTVQLLAYAPYGCVAQLLMPMPTTLWYYSTSTLELSTIWLPQELPCSRFMLIRMMSTKIDIKKLLVPHQKNSAAISCKECFAHK